LVKADIIIVGLQPHRLRKKIVIWLSWFVSFVWLNKNKQINKTNQINQINETAWLV
jgi:hypothetical protein